MGRSPFAKHTKGTAGHGGSVVTGGIADVGGVGWYVGMVVYGGINVGGIGDPGGGGYTGQIPLMLAKYERNGQK